MNLEPGGNATSHFNVINDGDLSIVGSPSFTVMRNDLVTTVPVTFASDIAGHYAVNFTVPNNWNEYDLVYVRMQLTYGLGASPRTIACTKPVGVVTATPLSVEFIADLLVADQVKTVANGVTTIQYFQQGTNQTVLLHEQIQSGDPCEGNVNLIAN